MRARGILLLVAAIVIGGLAVFLARDWIESQIPEPVVITENTVPLTTVVVARRDLFFGDRLRASFLQEQEWPKGNVPEGSFRKIDEVMAGEPVVIRRIAPNEPILRSKITGEGGRASLSAKVSESMRAITIRVNDVLGVAGYVLPGDRVDILLSRQGSSGRIVDIFLQNIHVLGIDQNANEEMQAGVQVARAVTIEVTPQQAQKIILAAQIGQMNLALRNYIDVEATRYRTVVMADLNVGEINQSPNAGPDSGPGSDPALGTSGVGVPVADTVVDPRTKVVITRGLSSKNYRVLPAPPQRSRGINLRSVQVGAPLPGQATPPPSRSSAQPVAFGEPRSLDEGQPVDLLNADRPTPEGISAFGLSAVPRPLNVVEPASSN